MDLLPICVKNFGNLKIRESHHIFKTPCLGDPRINIQKDGNMVKPYQVKMVMSALDKLNEIKKAGRRKGKIQKWEKIDWLINIHIGLNGRKKITRISRDVLNFHL
jgi:hypothetical protein